MSSICRECGDLLPQNRKGWEQLCFTCKIEYKITGRFLITGRGRVYTVEFDKPQLRKDIMNFKGKKIEGKEIIGIEMRGLGEDCYHKDCGFLVREE